MRRYLSQCFAVLTLGISLAVSAPGQAQTQPATGAAPASPAAAAAAPKGNESPEERAMTLFRQGIDAHKQGQLVEAEGFYRSAFELKKSYDIAGNLGDVELKLGKTRDAAEHLAFTIKNFPLTGRPELRERMQKALNEAKAQVTALRITANVDRADIFLDGQTKIGQAPIADEYFVDPGQHTIEARMKDHKPGTQVIQATRGGQQDVKLTLIPIAPPPPPKRSKVPAVVLGVVAGVGVGVGLGTFLAANSKLKTAVSLTDEIKADHGTCKDGGAVPVDPRCADLNSAKSTVNTLDAVAIGGATVGGLALVGMIVYLALPNPGAPAASSGSTGLHLNVLPTASRDSGGVLVSGSF